MTMDVEPSNVISTSTEINSQRRSASTFVFFLIAFGIPWATMLMASGIVLIQNFAGRLRQDILAVEAAVTEHWSNGVVADQVNRLKTLKRQMYGRAGVELLRARMIPLAPEPIAAQRRK